MALSMAGGRWYRAAPAGEWMQIPASLDAYLVLNPNRPLSSSHQVCVNFSIPLPVRVRKLVHVSDLHPAQWQGRTESGDFIFVRYRYGQLWIGLAPDYHRTPPTTVLETGYGDLGDGYLSFLSLRRRTRGVVDWPKRTRRPGPTL